MFTNKITDYIKSELNTYFLEKYSVVDLTMGNGNDTLFLAKKVGQAGKVYSFDIQEDAIENTQALLSKHNCLDRVQLIHDGHEHIEKYVKEKIHCAMMNLGYLPSGDHKIITRPTTTLIAIRKTLELLNHGGIFSIVVYYGHPGGLKERQVIDEFLQNLDPNKYHVFSCCYPNRKYAPIMHFIQRK